MREYDQIAEWYTRVRNPEVGAADVLDFARRLPPEARVLDLGCGSGVPVTGLLVREGFRVEALDSSEEMVARFSAHFPSVPVQHKRIQDAEYDAEAFSGVVAWGVWFHLSPEAQRAAIQKVSRWLASGGWFLFTSGGEAGETSGEMDGIPFQYTSLGVEEYREAIESAGMRLDHEYQDAWANHVYVAQRPVQPDASGARGA